MRKRVFLLNMVMMLSSLLILFLIITTSLRYMTNNILDNHNFVTKVNEDAIFVSEELENAKNKQCTDWDVIQDNLSSSNFQLRVCHDQKLIYPLTVDADEKDYVEKLEERHGTGPHSEGIYAIVGITCVVKEMKVENETYVLYALYYLEDENSLDNIVAANAWIYRIILIGSLTIIGLVLIGWIFSKHQVIRIVKPLESLIEYLKGAGQGDHSLKIDTKGDKEFEQAAKAFNTMQSDLESHELEIKELEERRTDMITSISHDLRTPLTSIKGYIKAVLDGVADTSEKQKTFLQIAYDTTGEMDQLLQKLFTFSKIETGKMPIDKVTLSLNELLSQYLEKRKVQYEERELSINYIGDDSGYEGKYDPLQMQRIFDNLLENSYHYANSQPVQITVTLQETDDEEIVVFHDNGEGVPEEKLQHIFERFYRCDEARSKDGNGIGLYVVKYIVEAHGGTIESVNENGFSIVLHFPKEEEQIDE